MHSDKQLAGTQGRNKRLTPKLYQKTKKSRTSDIKTDTMTAENGWRAAHWARYGDGTNPSGICILAERACFIFLGGCMQQKIDSGISERAMGLGPGQLPTSWLLISNYHIQLVKKKTVLPNAQIL